MPSRVYVNNCKFQSVHDAYATGIQEQVSLGTESHTWSIKLELAGLATVLGHRIRSVYSTEFTFANREFMDTTFTNDRCISSIFLVACFTKSSLFLVRHALVSEWLLS